MKPDLSNYEIWFSDWLDGKLNEQQVRELELFLKENPELKEELESIASICLKPGKFLFPGKEMLKKSAENYLPEQFEHLCIGFLENDLGREQLDELNDIIEKDSQKKKTFELISKLKLIPPTAEFSKKSSVKKLTTGARIFRLATIGLTAAATIIIILLFRLPGQGIKDSSKVQIAGTIASDTLLIDKPVPVENPLPVEKPIPVKKEDRRVFAGTSVAAHENNTSVGEIKSQDTTSRVAGAITAHTGIETPVQSHSDYQVTKLAVAVSPVIVSDYESQRSGLMAFKTLPLPPFFDDGRSNVERFMAKFFHERIMKDADSGNRPVESFEIAEAGITGLNKLFGWQLALHKNTGENGEVVSYYFSSKLIKFNAPVKKPMKEL